MKTLGKFLVIISVLAASFSATAMTTDPIKKAKQSTAKGEVTQVKLLPAANGKIKVLYVNSSEDHIKVKITGHEVLFSDKIRLDKSAKGFLKTYSFDGMSEGSYSIEVSDSKMSVSYEVEKRSNNTIWANYWDAFLPEEQPAEPIIASLK